MELRPIRLSPKLNADGIYESSSDDGKAIFTMIPRTKRFVLSWHDMTQPGAEDLACVSFIKGFCEYVTPIAAKDDEKISKHEWQFLQDMNAAFAGCKKIMHPDGAVVH